MVYDAYYVWLDGRARENRKRAEDNTRLDAGLCSLKALIYQQALDHYRDFLRGNNSTAI